jgi:hypothetical protein
LALNLLAIIILLAAATIILTLHHEFSTSMPAYGSCSWLVVAYVQKVMTGWGLFALLRTFKAQSRQADIIDE